MLEALRDAILDWYILLSSFSADVTAQVLALDRWIGIAPASALLLGLVGAAAPCQLTTGIGALAILGGTRTERPRLQAVLAYLAGKALVYTALGLVAVVVGAGLSEFSIPVFVAARKALGPLMIIIGLVVAGMLRPPPLPGNSAARRLLATVRRRAGGAPFLLGIAFGFSFCPTLFALFFGFLVPLALARPDGPLYPALFALGTSLPLLLVLGLLGAGGGRLRERARQVGRWQRGVAVLAGAALVIAGLHDTVVYWLL